MGGSKRPASAISRATDGTRESQGMSSAHTSVQMDTEVLDSAEIGGDDVPTGRECKRAKSGVSLPLPIIISASQGRPRKYFFRIE